MRDPLCAEPAIATCSGNAMVEAAVSADQFRCCVPDAPIPLLFRCYSIVPKTSGSAASH
jgi:hypothetical protein